MTDLPVPQFIDTSPEAVEADIIAAWEAIAGKQLFPGQPERLLINLLTYRETLVRIGIAYAAEQSLVNLAVGASLDQLGALVLAPRLAASSAQTTIRFTLAATRAVSTLIPAGTRVRVPGAEIIFQADANATIAAGQTTVDAIATCTDTGIIGNGFTAGQITQLLDPPTGYTLSASNTTESSGGADIETDDAYRERIKLAPSQFSTAGPRDAYKFHVLSVSQTIIDATITLPNNAAGGLLRLYVDVYPLTSTGIPSSELITAIQTALDNNQIRPLCDIVTVKEPTEVNYTIDADIILLETADVTTTETAIAAAVNAYIAERASELGQDIILSQIIGAIASVPGVYDVTLNTPAADIVVDETEWANHTGTLTLNVTGTNEG